jgi:hypothetical protein
MPAIAEGKTNERPAKKFSGSRRKIKVLAWTTKGAGYWTMELRRKSKGLGEIDEQFEELSRVCATSWLTWSPPSESSVMSIVIMS